MMNIHQRIAAFRQHIRNQELSLQHINNRYCFYKTVILIVNSSIIIGTLSPADQACTLDGYHVMFMVVYLLFSALLNGVLLLMYCQRQFEPLTNTAYISFLINLAALVTMVIKEKPKNCERIDTMMLVFILGMVVDTIISMWFKFIAVLVETVPPTPTLRVYQYMDGHLIGGGQRISTGDTTCPIELDEFRNGDAVVRLTCSHIFKREAIEQWLAQGGTCPLCRTSQGQPPENRIMDVLPIAIQPRVEAPVLAPTLATAV